MEIKDTRDEMILDILGNIRFGRYDRKAVQNFFNMYISKNKGLTKAQNQLFEKIIRKYKRQFLKLDIDCEDILKKPWKNKIVHPLNDKKPFFEINDDDQMELYFKFHSSMIDGVRSIVNDNQKNYINKLCQLNFNRYDFTWIPKERVYRGKFHIYLFKELCQFANKHNIEIGPNAKKLIQDLKSYGRKEFWQPKLEIINGRIYISSITESMLPYLNNIDPYDMSMPNVEQMVKLSIKIPDDMFGNLTPFVNNLFTPADPFIVDNMKDIEMCSEYAMESKRKCILYGSGNTRKMFKWENLILVGRNVTMESIDNLLKDGYNTIFTTVNLDYYLRNQNPIGVFALKADKVIPVRLTDSDLYQYIVRESDQFTNNNNNNNNDQSNNRRKRRS